MSISLTLRLENRHVCIVGGGLVAYRKAVQYQKEGAILQIIATSFLPEFDVFPTSMLRTASFDWAFIDAQCFLIYVASDDETLNTAILKEAKKRNILCGCSMKNKEADFESMYSNTKDTTTLAFTSTCPGANQAIYHHYLSPIHEKIESVTSPLQIIRKTLLKQQVAKKQIHQVLQQLAILPYTYAKTIVHALQMQQPIILLAYHGIANIQQEQTTLEQMHERLVEKHHDCMSVFFSDKVMQKARKKGFDIASLQEMIEVLQIMSLPYHIQPMLLQQGKMYQECEKQASNHHIGLPLLTCKEDVTSIMTQLYQQYQTTLLGIYHPSQSALFSTCNNPKTLLCSIEDTSIIESLEHDVIVLPFFLLYGYHAKKDIEQIWMPMLWKQGINAQLVPKGLLSYACMQEMFLKRIVQDISKKSDFV